MSVFRFKQFQVRQDQCAMKVGTDGVLLGAWANLTMASSILDIGTGTGLIALMAAQRNTNCLVKAIEIDGQAAEQAQSNVSESPFSNRVDVVCSDVKTQKFTRRFDHIVSNPPFFNNTHKPTEMGRAMARHDDVLTLFDILDTAQKLGTDEHLVSLVYPYGLFYDQIDHITERGYFLRRVCRVKPTPTKTPHRVMVEFSNSGYAKPDETEMSIEIARHNYTKEYQDLCREFYLGM